MKSARGTLEKSVQIRSSREGVISVTATANSPKMAADLANFYVENLDRLHTRLNVTEAGRSRAFLETRVAEAEKGLRDAEDNLRTYQSQTKAVIMEGQAKAAIESMARLEGQILASEVQLRALETYATTKNPDVIRLRESIQEMREQLRRMEYGRESQSSGPTAPTADGRRVAQAAGRGKGGAVGDFAVPLGAIPETGTELARRLREVKIQETIFTLLTQQLEQAKITEAQDTPTARILDRAVPPEWKARPAVVKNAGLAALLSLVFGIGLAIVLESLRVSREQRSRVHVQGDEPRMGPA
jgi:uncharacterized protein involved in exopolysaccharide biosynthesis